MKSVDKLQAATESRAEKELGAMRKTSERVAAIDRATVMRAAHSLYRRRLFDNWSECLRYSWRVARDRRDLAARQSQTAAMAV